MTRRSNRRQFLQTSGLAASAVTGYWLTGGLTSAQDEKKTEQKTQPAANRLNVAIIGAGGRGSANVGGVAGENIVALCDADENNARGVYDRYPNVPKFQDFRVMLDRVRNIDAVAISTPDHMHAICAMTAIRAGKHVYVEKPLAHNVWEVRQLREAAARHRIVSQMGNQGTSDGGLREAVEVIRAGAIGEVREIHVWTNRPIWPQGMTARPNGNPMIPTTLNWDRWLGGAQERPYHPDYLPFKWRGWWDFGTGALGDMGCHTMNLPFMALRLGAPSSIIAETDQPVNVESPPRGALVTYQFPARGDLPAVTLKWYEVRRPPAELLQGQMRSDSGCVMVGSRGSMYSPSDYGGTYRLLPVENFRDYQKPARTLPRSPGHHQEWIRAIKGDGQAMSNIVDHAGPLTEMVLLGNVAMRMPGQLLEWNTEQLRITNVADANQYLRREYRRGWDAPFQA